VWWWVWRGGGGGGGCGGGGREAGLVYGEWCMSCMILFADAGSHPSDAILGSPNGISIVVRDSYMFDILRSTLFASLLVN
jgi:hypothetical protein